MLARVSAQVKVGVRRMGQLTLALGGALWAFTCADSAPVEAALSEAAQRGAHGSSLDLSFDHGANSVVAIDSHQLKRAPRMFEELFKDDLNELSAAMAPAAHNDDISEFEPPPPITTFQRVWRAKGSLRSSGAGTGLDTSHALTRKQAVTQDLAVPYIGDASSASSSTIRVGFDDQIIGFDALTRASVKNHNSPEPLSPLQAAALIHATEQADAQVAGRLAVVDVQTQLQTITPAPKLSMAKAESAETAAPAAVLPVAPTENQDGESTAGSSAGAVADDGAAQPYGQCPMGHQWRIAVMRFGTNYYYDEQFYQTITGLIAHKLIDTSQLSIEQGPHVRTTERGRIYALEGLEGRGANYNMVVTHQSARRAGAPLPTRSLSPASNFDLYSNFNQEQANAAQSLAQKSAQEVLEGLTADPYAKSAALGPHNQRIGVIAGTEPLGLPTADLVPSNVYELWHQQGDHTHRSDYYMPLFKNFTDADGYSYYVELTRNSCFSLQADGYYSSEWDIDLHRQQVAQVYQRARQGEIDLILVFGLYDISIFDQMNFDIPIIVVGHDQDILYNSMAQGVSSGLTAPQPSQPRNQEVTPPTWTVSSDHSHTEDSSTRETAVLEVERDDTIMRLRRAAIVPAEQASTARESTPSADDFKVTVNGSSLFVPPESQEGMVSATSPEVSTCPAQQVQQERAKGFGIAHGFDASPEELLAQLGPKAEVTLGIVTDHAFSLGEFSPYRNIFVHLDPIMHYDDLVNFYHMMGFKKLGVIVDHSHTFRQLHSIEEIRSTMEPLNVETQICTGELITKDRAKAQAEFARCTTELIAGGVDAVYLTRTSATTINRLYSQLWPFIERGIAVFSRGSTAEVKAGALMSYSYGYSEAFRHYQAQVICDVMNGRSINTLSQYFYPRTLLTVNAKIASLIGWYPSYHDLSKIDLTYLDVVAN